MYIYSISSAFVKINPVIDTTAEAIHAAPKIHFILFNSPYPNITGNKSAHKHHAECVYFIANITVTAVEIHATAFANSIY